MPPSGYPRRDAQTIASFLSSCVEALQAENDASLRSPTDALRREIAGIESVVAKHAKEPFALYTLNLTRAFYERLLEYKPSSAAELRGLLPRVLDEVVSQIARVHVEDYSLIQKGTT